MRKLFFSSHEQGCSNQIEGNLATWNLEWNFARNQWHQLLGAGGY